ncbi:MAG TPA: protease modulator HflC [Acetobacteraceae bacterium]
MNRLMLGGIAAAVILVLAAASLFTVVQTEQVLITQFGQPIRVINTPGLHVKVPFVQTVITFDRRLLDYETPGEEVILSDQRRLIVDSFTRFRITDPLRYFQTVGPAENNIRGRLNSVVTSALRRVLGGETLLNVLSADRGRIMGLVRGQVTDEMRQFGVAVEDVRLRRADLPEENTTAILNRMKSERERIARQARAEGAEASARIRADAERERTVLLARARADSDRLRGEGERESTKIYADAFGRDPEFYSTYRTLQAYRDTFIGGQSRLVLTPDSDFLRMLREAPKP